MPAHPPYLKFSLDALRKDPRGFILVEKVESYSPFPPPHGRREDLFGILDIICLSVDGPVVGVQATSVGSKSAHKKKLLEHPNTRKVLEAGWVIELHAWKQPGGKGTRWQLDKLTFELPKGTSDG